MHSQPQLPSSVPLYQLGLKKFEFLLALGVRCACRSPAARHLLHHFDILENLAFTSAMFLHPRSHGADAILKAGLCLLSKNPLRFGMVRKRDLYLIPWVEIGNFA